MIIYLNVIIFSASDSNEKIQIDDNRKKDVTGMMADIEISEGRK